MSFRTIDAIGVAGGTRNTSLKPGVSFVLAGLRIEIARVRSLMAMPDGGWTVSGRAPVLAVLPAVDISATTA